MTVANTVLATERMFENTSARVYRTPIGLPRFSIDHRYDILGNTTSQTRSAFVTAHRHCFSRVCLSFAIQNDFSFIARLASSTKYVDILLWYTLIQRLLN